MQQNIDLSVVKLTCEMLAEHYESLNPEDWSDDATVVIDLSLEQVRLHSNIDDTIIAHKNFD